MWATADTHIQHRRCLGFCRRPWLYLNTDNHRREAEGLPYDIPDELVKAHDDALIANINEAVAEGDLFIHLGDVAFGGARRLSVLRDFWDRLRCRNILVLAGNHDDEAELRSVFGDDAVHERLRFEVESPGGLRNLIADHYPGRSWWGSHKGWGQIHGHSHSGNATRWGEGLQLDVGVDGHDYRPWNLREVILPEMDRRAAVKSQAGDSD